MLTHLLFCGMLYIVGAFASLGLYEAWLKSRLPIHVFQLLYRLGWKRNEPDFWPDPFTVKHWLRHEWEPWVQQRLRDPWWAPGGELLTCPYCINYHISLWCGMVLGLVTGEPWMALAGIISWPGVLRFFTRE